MPRKPIPGCAPRTINLHVESYEAILDFFSRSPSGVTGAEAIRTIVHEYGRLCAQALAGQIDASLLDVSKIPAFVEDFYRKRSS